MYQPGNSRKKYFSTAELAAALIISIIAGIVASTGDFIYVVALIGAVIAIFMGLSPVALLGAMILIGLVFSGTFRTYFPQLEYIRWAVLPGSIALIMHALASGWSKNNRGDTKFPAILWWAIAFVVVSISSGVINGVNSNVYLPSYKGYFQVWGILIGLAFIQYDEKTIAKLPKLFLIIALIQLPLVLQQYFILAPTRIGIAKGIVPIDVVSGTFGISAMGGNNALLSAFLYICLAGVIALWQEKVWSTKLALLVGSIVFFPTLMNEAKVGLLFLVAIFFILFFKYIFSSFKNFLLTVMGFVLSLSILLVAFTVNVHEASDVNNPLELLKYTYESNIETDQSWDGDLSRFGTYKYWFERHGINNIRKAMIGYGVGASREMQEQKNTFKIATGGPDASIGIGSTAFSAILWESGVLGMITVMGLFISGFIGAVKLSKKFIDDDFQRAIFRGISAAFAVLFIDFMTKNYFMFQVGYQTILFTLLGYIVYWDRRLSDKSKDVSEKVY